MSHDECFSKYSFGTSNFSIIWEFIICNSQFYPRPVGIWKLWESGTRSPVFQRKSSGWLWCFQLEPFAWTAETKGVLKNPSGVFLHEASLLSCLFLVQPGSILDFALMMRTFCYYNLLDGEKSCWEITLLAAADELKKWKMKIQSFWRKADLTGIRLYLRKNSIWKCEKVICFEWDKLLEMFLYARLELVKGKYWIYGL